MDTATEKRHLANLNPSKLGTREYWDECYQKELEDENEEVPADPLTLDSWFDECDAPEKVLEYLTDEDFPLSPNNPDRTVATPSVLDLGTGNGSALLQLRIEGRWRGRLVGVDYSTGSVEVARKLWKGYVAAQDEDGDEQSKLRESDVQFEQMDIINDVPEQHGWWPADGFDLVHDKGTFDAVSLSGETFADENGEQRRIHEKYPSKVAKMVKIGGYVIVTSCNWTEEEVVQWFSQGAEVKEVLKEFGRVKYPTYEFHGKTGQGVASVCFQRIR